MDDRGRVFDESLNVGWRGIIFVPEKKFWQFFVALTVYTECVINIHRLTYDDNSNSLRGWEYFCDTFYFMDFSCSLLQYNMPSVRRLSKHKPRHWSLLIIDGISLFPVEIVYDTFIVETGTVYSVLQTLLHCNKCLRFYRLYLYFTRAKLHVKNSLTYIVISYLEIVSYVYMTSHVLSCIWYTMGSKEEKSFCQKHLLTCVMNNELNFAFLIMHHYTGDQTRVLNTDKRRALAALTIEVGYMFHYGLAIPLLTFAFLKSFRSFFEFTKKFKILKMVVGNIIPSKFLREKTLHYFKTAWTKGTGHDEPQILYSLPLSMRKDIFSDIHWDAMRHSMILNDVSKSCKRAIALNIKTEFVLPDAIIMSIGEIKTKMIYVATGVLQIMAEENEESAVLCLSGGTILGENSMFIPNKNKAKIKAATFTEIHLLSGVDLFRVLLDYPKDRKLVFQRFIVRHRLARMTEYRKRFVQHMSMSENQFDEDHEDAVKWLKHQSRAIMESHKNHVMITKARREGLHVPSFKESYQLQTKLDRMSNFLELLVMSEDVEVQTDVVCLRTTCPWMMDPDCHFIGLWDNIILCMVFFVSIVYPAMICWHQRLPHWFFNITVFISIFFITDVVLQLLTAIKTKETIISDFWGVFRTRLQSPLFYVDIISAVPLQILVLITENRKNLPPYVLGLCLVPSLLKVYRILYFYNTWNRSLNSNTIVVTMLKYVFLLTLFIYWAAAFLHLASVECIFYKCKKDDWLDMFLKLYGDSNHDHGAVYFAIVIAADVPATIFPTSIQSIVTVAVLVNFFGFFMCMWYGEYIATYISEKSYEFKFQGLVELITNFMTVHRTGGRLRKRIISTMRFQWDYDLGDYLMQTEGMLSTAPEKLMNEINADSVQKTIRKSEFFDSEDPELLEEIAHDAVFIALPADSVILTFGAQTMKLHLVHKGYCQLNSFLVNDITDGMAAPIVSKPGSTFPIIVALTQRPTAVSAVTLTDCELVILSLETVLAKMIKFEAFKDTVQTLKRMDFRAIFEPKLSLASYKDPFRMKEPENYDEPLMRHNIVLRFFLMKFLRRTPISPQSKFFERWELARVIGICIGCLTWPMLHSFLTNSISDTVVFLLLIDIQGYADMYIRMHVAYFNRNGILVTHTLYTAKHYLSTSFITDLLSSTPFYVFYRAGLKSSETSPPGWVVVHLLLRMVGIYRLWGFISYQQAFSHTAYLLHLVKYCLVMVIIVNCYVCIMCNFDVHWYYKNGKWYFEHQQTIVDWAKYPVATTIDRLYLLLLYGTTVTITRSEYFYESLSGYAMVSKTLITLFGWIILIIVFSFVTSRATSANMNFTIYQYRMKNFVRYLNIEKAEDKISNLAIEHFEYEWLKKRGEDLRSIFSRFPDSLHEDLMFPLYRVTVSVVHCLSGANESFYRQLSRNLSEVYLKKGMPIIFEKEVQSDIYFVHSGQCIVAATSLVLKRGSMIGNIRKKGIMTNTINALTHVDLLKIPSTTFFLIMNNFYDTERDFLSAVLKVDDHVESDYKVDTRKSKSKKAKEIGIQPPEENNQNEDKEEDQEQSVFEIITNDTKHTEKRMKEAERELEEEEKEELKSQFTLLLHPESRITHCMYPVYVVSAYMTMILIPLIIGLRTITMVTVAIVRILDIIWLVKIIVTLITAYYDPVTGNLIVQKSDIFLRYLGAMDGLIVDSVSILPLELIPIWFAKSLSMEPNYETVQTCLMFRLLRISCLLNFVNEQGKKLSVSYYLRWTIIIGHQFLMINTFTAIYLLIAKDPKVALDKFFTAWTDRQNQALIWSYLHVVNLYAGAGFHTFLPTTYTEMLYVIVLCYLATIEKAVVINQVLSIVNVAYHTKSEYLHKMQTLERYLTARDISPALMDHVREYGCDLLDLFRAEAMPWFLTQAPHFLQVGIMHDLYLDHLTECYIFHDASKDFLKQLSARLKREIYFPGEKITEKGDVDYNMYFVHRGEVNSLQYDVVYERMEVVVDSFKEDESFGLMQGIFKSLAHSHTYRARTVVDLLILNFHEWSDLRLAFPDVTKQIYERAKNSMNKNVQIALAPPARQSVS